MPLSMTRSAIVVWLAVVTVDVDAFVLPARTDLEHRPVLSQRTFARTTKVRKDNFGMLQNRQEPPIGEKRLWPKLLAIVATITAGVSLRTTPLAANPRMVQGVVASLVTGLAALILFRRAALKSTDSEEDEAMEMKNSSTDMWVSHRLEKAEELERQNNERRREEEAEREAARVARARKWASTTLQTTKEAIAKAEAERQRKEEEQRKAQIWLASTTRGSGIELEGRSSQTTTSDEGENRTIDSDERRDLSYRSGERGTQLWVENAVRGTGTGRSGQTRSAEDNTSTDLEEGESNP